MSCPNCEIDLSCPCKNCVGYRRERGEFKALLWEWIDNETMQCPICGFYAHANIWEDWDFYLYDKAREKLSKNQGMYIFEAIKKWRNKQSQIEKQN